MQGGAALLFREETLDSVQLAAAVAELSTDPPRRAAMATQARGLALPDAAQAVAAACLEVAR